MRHQQGEPSPLLARRGAAHINRYCVATKECAAGWWTKIRQTESLEQPPRLRQCGCLRDYFLLAQPPLLARRGDGCSRILEPVRCISTAAHVSCVGLQPVFQMSTTCREIQRLPVRVRSHPVKRQRLDGCRVRGIEIHVLREAISV